MAVVISAIHPAADSAYTTHRINLTNSRLYMHGLTWSNRRSVLLNNVKYNVRNIFPNEWSGPFLRLTAYFDGSTNYGYVPYERSRLCATDLTLCAWVYPEVIGAATLFASGVNGDTNNQWSISLSATNELLFTWYDGATDVVVSSGLYVPTDAWSFIAVRRREVNPSSMAASSVYFIVGLNGGAIASTRGGMVVSGGGNPDVYIGRNAIGGTGFFQGYMCFPQLMDFATYTDEMESARDSFSAIGWGVLKYDMVDGSGDTLTDLAVSPEVWM